MRARDLIPPPVLTPPSLGPVPPRREEIWAECGRCYWSGYRRQTRGRCPGCGGEIEWYANREPRKVRGAKERQPSASPRWVSPKTGKVFLGSYVRDERLRWRRPRSADMGEMLMRIYSGPYIADLSFKRSPFLSLLTKRKGETMQTTSIETHEKIEQIARVAHEANRAYCRSIGDESQVPWLDAPDWQRTSALNGVRAALSGEAQSAEQQHEAWMRDKVAAGWTLGTVKDAEAKTHPCLVPYDKLPPEQQAKDRLFRAVVEALSV